MRWGRVNLLVFAAPGVMRYRRDPTDRLVTCEVVWGQGSQGQTDVIIRGGDYVTAAASRSHTLSVKGLV